MGSEGGLSDTQLLAVSEQQAGPEAAAVFAELFDGATCAALAYAEAMTTGDVDDALFAQLMEHFDADQLVELTEVVAWENASARFNRALRVPSQELWRPQRPDPATDGIPANGERPTDGENPSSAKNPPFRKRHAN